MAIIHSAPKVDDIKHDVNHGAAGCWCEPKIVDFGLGRDGKPSRLVVHQNLRVKAAREEKGELSGSRRDHR